MVKNWKSCDTVPLKTEDKSCLGQNGENQGGTPPPPALTPPPLPPPRSFGFSKYSWNKWSVPVCSILQDAKNKRLLLLRILIFLYVAFEHSLKSCFFKYSMYSELKHRKNT